MGSQRVATLQSKLVHVLTVDDAHDMYSRDSIAMFKERRRLKSKKFYGDYVLEEKIATSSEDKDDIEFVKSDPPSPIAFPGMVRVEPKILTVQEENKKMLRGKEQRDRLQKNVGEKPYKQNKVVELRPFLLEQKQLREMAQPSSNADLITRIPRASLCSPCRCRLSASRT